MKAYGYFWRSVYEDDVTGLSSLGVASHQFRPSSKSGEARGQRGNTKGRVRKVLKSAARWKARRELAASRD